MIPAAFDYVRASSVDDAIRLLGEHGDDAKLLAGGHSLIPMMKLRLAAPATLIDITGIPQLDAIRVEGNRVTIGALTKHAALAASDVVGKGGERQLQAGDFFRGMFDTALKAGEVLTTIAFDAAPNSAYLKYHHPASHYAVVGSAVALTVDGGTIGSARVGITGVGDSAFRAGGVERALAGVRAGDDAAVAAACAGAASGQDARSDTFASGAYRAAMADVFTARAVARAALR
jgi:carbon-monoxide dehydrogenase medium subunit